MPDLSWREGLVMAPLLGLIVFLGVYPEADARSHRARPSTGLVTHIEDHSDYVEPEVAKTGPAAEDESADEEHEEAHP